MSMSVIILTKNESKNIEKCIMSLKWADETIVIDDNSTDNTIKIAQKHNAKAVKRFLDNDFAKQRNFGLDLAKSEWVLFVDADEIVSEDLRNEIIKYTNNPISKYQGFYIKRTDTMWGKKLLHGDGGNVSLLRLAKKNAGKWIGTVHETWNVIGPTLTLKNSLQHFPHPTIDEFLTEINFYTTIRAQELFHQGEKATWLDILLYPKAKFFQDYILKLGFLDGMQGFIVALLMSFHSFLVRGKLWQLTDK